MRLFDQGARDLRTFGITLWQNSRQVPICQRVVKSHFHACLVAGVCKFRHQILARTYLHRGKVGYFAIEKTISVVVTRGKNHILPSCFLCQCHPTGRIIVCSMEIFGKCFVGTERNMLLIQDPFTASFCRIDSPMDKHTKTGILPPTNTAPVFLTKGMQGCCYQQQSEQYSLHMQFFQFE